MVGKQVSVEETERRISKEAQFAEMLFMRGDKSQMQIRAL
jgi:hypothetical protein